MLKSLYENAGIESPTKLRVQQLADRLFHLQAGLEEEKMSRLESFQAKLRTLDSKIDSSSLNFENKFKALRDQLAKLSNTLASEQASRELLNDRKIKELKLVENSLQIDLNLLKHSRKEQEIKVTKLLDDKLHLVKYDLAKERKIREEVSEQQSTRLSDSINRLNAVVEEETTSRQEGMESLNGHIQEELQKFEDEIFNEKSEREEANAALAKMLEDMQERLLQEIVSERNEREGTEETLLKLLEETCQRVETSLRS